MVGICWYDVADGSVSNEAQTGNCDFGSSGTEKEVLTHHQLGSLRLDLHVDIERKALPRVVVVHVRSHDSC